MKYKGPGVGGASRSSRCSSFVFISSGEGVGGRSDPRGACPTSTQRGVRKNNSIESLRWVEKWHD